MFLWARNSRACKLDSGRLLSSNHQNVATVPSEEGVPPLFIVAIALITFIVVFWRLGASSFWDPDEAHYAETTREMVTTGDWWAPYYNEQPYFDKPVLFHQLQAAATMVFGPNEFAARLVPALAASAIVVLTAWLGAKLASPNVAVVAALLMASSPGLFALARYAILDTLFTAFMFGAASLVAVAALGDRRALQYPGYVLLGIAVLVKGPIALVLCGLAFLTAIAVSSDARRRLLGLRWGVGLLVSTSISAPWFIYMYLRFGQAFVDGYVFDENLKLFASSRFGNQPGPWFYFQILAAGLLPWTGLLLGRLVDDVRAALARRKVDTFEVFLWAWTATIVGLFTASTFKLDHYIFPAAPALCLLSARAWQAVRTDPHAPENKATLVGLHLVGPLLVAIGTGGGYLMIARLDLPAASIVVPVAMTLAGVITTMRVKVGGGRPPHRIPWVPLAAVTITYAGILLWVMPALEASKVVPDLARWVGANAGTDGRVGAYRLNRWSAAFRFYVDRHTDMLETEQEARAFFERPGLFYVAMLEPAYDEFVARGVPLKVVRLREGMWATSGRVLWRRRLPPTRFVVVTRAGT